MMRLSNQLSEMRILEMRILSIFVSWSVVWKSMLQLCRRLHGGTKLGFEAVVALHDCVLLRIADYNKAGTCATTSSLLKAQVILHAT